MMKYSIIALLISIVSFDVLGQQIGLDSTFGNNGILYEDTGTCGELLVAPDQSILASGRIITEGSSTYYLYKYDTDGILNPNFGNNGRFHPSFGGISPICLQEDGKILLAGGADTGTTNSDVMILRLNQNGSLDNSFGEGGMTVSNLAHYWNSIWDAEPQDGAYSLAIQSTEKIIVLGKSNDEIALVRYTQSGMIDSTFGQYGIAIQNVGGYENDPNDLAILPDDRLVCGFRATINSQGAMCAMRFLPDGSIDSSFNQIGFASFSDGWLTYCNAMCLQSDGKVLLAGYSDSALIVRFDSTGVLDPTFGNAGACKLPPATIRDMVLMQDGKILITGTRNNNFITYRCFPNGRMDTTFGDNGIVETDLQQGGEDDANTIALQQDNKIVVAGSSPIPNDPGFNNRFVLIRYMQDGHSSIKEFPEFNGTLRIFPNPAESTLNIHWVGEDPLKAGIFIYDILGRILLFKPDQLLSNTVVSLDISSFASGVYCVKIAGINGVRREHFFVKK